MRPKTPEISLQDKIDAVERLLDDLQWARNDPACPEFATFYALKAIALDIRGRMPGKAEEVRRVLGSRIGNAVRSRTALGYEIMHLKGIGEELIGRWPVVEQALEQFERRR